MWGTSVRPWLAEMEVESEVRSSQSRSPMQQAWGAYADDDDDDDDNARY